MDNKFIKVMSCPYVCLVEFKGIKFEELIFERLPKENKLDVDE